MIMKKMIKYPFKVFQTEVEGHVFWVAKSIYLKGCVGQGDVQEDDKVANSKDGQVLGRGAVDLILQGTLWTHTRPDPLTQELGQRAPCM